MGFGSWYTRILSRTIIRTIVSLELPGLAEGARSSIPAGASLSFSGSGTSLTRMSPVSGSSKKLWTFLLLQQGTGKCRSLEEPQRTCHACVYSTTKAWKQSNLQVLQGQVSFRAARSAWPPTLPPQHSTWGIKS